MGFAGEISTAQLLFLSVSQQRRNNDIVIVTFLKTDSMQNIRRMNTHRQEGTLLGYWHQRADEILGNSPKVTWSLSWSRRGWNTPVEFGLSKSVECDTFAFRFLTLLVGL